MQRNFLLYGVRALWSSPPAFRERDGATAARRQQQQRLNRVAICTGHHAAHTHTHTHSYTRCTAPPQPRSEPGAAQAAKHMINRHRGHVWLGQSTPNNTHSHTPHMYKVWKCQPHWPAIPPSAGTARPTPPRGRGPDNWKTKHIACHCTAGCTTVLRKIEKIL